MRRYEVLGTPVVVVVGPSVLTSMIVRPASRGSPLSRPLPFTSLNKKPWIEVCSKSPKASPAESASVWPGKEGACRTGDRHQLLAAGEREVRCVRRSPPTGLRQSPTVYVPGAKAGPAGCLAPAAAYI